MHPSHKTQVHNKQSPRYAHENPNHAINLPMQTWGKKMKNSNKLDEFEEKLRGDTGHDYGFYAAVVAVFAGLLGWCWGIGAGLLWLIKH